MFSLASVPFFHPSFPRFCQEVLRITLGCTAAAGKVRELRRTNIQAREQDLLMCYEATAVNTLR